MRNAAFLHIFTMLIQKVMSYDESCDLKKDGEYQLRRYSFAFQT